MLLLHKSNHFKNRNLYQLSLTGVFFNENVKLYKFDGVKLRCPVRKSGVADFQIKS